jgi:hypothetical protein
MKLSLKERDFPEALPFEKMDYSSKKRLRVSIMVGIIGTFGPT